MFHSFFLDFLHFFFVFICQPPVVGFRWFLSLSIDDNEVVIFDVFAVLVPPIFGNVPRHEWSRLYEWYEFAGFFVRAYVLLFAAQFFCYVACGVACGLECYGADAHLSESPYLLEQGARPE